MNLRDWLAERQQNALAIAAMKRGADRAGWLEDAEYFRRAADAIDSRPLAVVAEELRKMMTDQGIVRSVALDIARWFVNGDKPDEFKLKEWAERLDCDAIAKAYDERAK